MKMFINYISQYDGGQSLMMMDYFLFYEFMRHSFSIFMILMDLELFFEVEKKIQGGYPIWFSS